ncbi:hypothetical protein EDD99_8103 [Streptomyces sp. 846.5]|nr:hypothetical protein [Streptomyces sp. 846.5]TDT93294.1 hypothetical protein EDD99_8103 [Streptomyces sp. 846.5]
MGTDVESRDVDAEALMLADVRGFAQRVPQPLPGWRYASVYALLLDVGRLFTPRTWPDGGPPPGETGRCYTESASWAWGSPDGLAYVEGFAWTGLYPMEHAWCADRDGFGLDPTWSDPASAYLGLPVLAAAAVELMGRHREPLLAHGTVCRDWMEHGVPGELLADVGRPVPAQVTR